MIPRADNTLSTDVLHDWKQAAASWLDNAGSDQTRRAYRQAWAAFLSFANVAPEQVTQDHVIAYRRHLETSKSPKTGKPYTQGTINLHLTALSSFFTWAKDRGLRSDNPTDGVKRKAVTPYGKATWLRSEDGEDLRFLEVIDATTPRGPRDRAIMLLFLTLALRVAEVASLRIGSLRRQGKKVFLTYTRKRGYTKEVELPKETAEAIGDYLKTRILLTDTSPLFTASEAGREAARRLGHDAGEETPLTSRAIAGLVNSYGNKALGKGHGIHPHSLRHTAAMTAAKDGHSIMDVSDLLGHASLQITTIYLHATGQATAKVAADLGRRYGRRQP
jgi:site-specific recombinase XerD